MKVVAAPGGGVVVIILLIYAGGEFQKTQFPSLPGGATWGRQIPTKVSLTTHEAEDVRNVHVFTELVILKPNVKMVVLVPQSKSQILVCWVLFRQQIFLCSHEKMLNPHSLMEEPRV